MSETSKSKNISNKTITCMVYGAENDKLIIKDSNEQPTNIPGIPMEISVEPHTFEMAPNGEIIRKGKSGEKLSGKVTDKKVINAVKKEQETIR